MHGSPFKEAAPPPPPPDLSVEDIEPSPKHGRSGGGAGSPLHPTLAVRGSSHGQRSGAGITQLHTAGRQRVARGPQSQPKPFSFSGYLQSFLSFSPPPPPTPEIPAHTPQGVLR